MKGFLCLCLWLPVKDDLLYWCHLTFSEKIFFLALKFRRVLCSLVLFSFAGAVQTNKCPGNFIFDFWFCLRSLEKLDILFEVKNCFAELEKREN